MAVPKVAPQPAAELARLLDSPEIGRLVEELEATRWTGRPGYGLKTMVGLTLAKSLYALPTWTKVVALVADHWKLQRVLGCEGNSPSIYAAYRFQEKLLGGVNLARKRGIHDLPTSANPLGDSRCEFR